MKIVSACAAMLLLANNVNAQAKWDNSAKNKLSTTSQTKNVVINNRHQDARLVINSKSSKYPTDKLSIRGAIGFNPANEADYGIIRGRSNSGGLMLWGNSSWDDGSGLMINGYKGGGDINFVASVPDSLQAAFRFWHKRITNVMTIFKNGKVVIGAELMANTPGTYKLYVKDGILTEKLRVANNLDPLNWADFVFDDNYELMPLQKLESYITANKHLPEIPSATDVSKNGIDIAEMDAKLLQKIEELTLYVIQQQKEIDELKKQLSRQ